jgi:hypothetical protein
MNETRIAAVTVFLGLLGLVYGGFSYIEEADAMKTAPIQASAENTEMLSIPIWLGGGAIVAGLLLLIVRTKG